MFKKSIAAVALAFMMILSIGTGAFASEIKIIDEVPSYGYQEGMSVDELEAIEEVNKVNAKIEAEIGKNQEKADKLYTQYTVKLAKETDAKKQAQLTAKYEEQITKLIVDLQVKAEKMTVKGMEKATAAGIKVEMVYVNVQFGDRSALIDPIVVVSW
jgi:hypothetical protein